MSDIICIFGSYSIKPGETLYELAYDVGYSLAHAGYVVANGGYQGIMEASAKGAKDAGGMTIGVTCSVFEKTKEGAVHVNPYIDKQIHHHHILQRIKEMMTMSSGYVVLEGGTGTLSEFGLVWEYISKRLISPRPIFVVGDFWRPIIERILANRPHHGQHLHLVTTAQEIVKIAASAIRPHSSASRRRIQAASFRHQVHTLPG
jgi:uncharacterized protein (TIGR00725 family)